MTDKTATECLREMLDERGVEYTKRDGMKATSITSITHWYADGIDAEFAEQIKGGTRLSVTRLTPEQAVAATLGGGECEMETLERCDGMEPHYRCRVCRHENYEDDLPSYCPNCGRKVKR